ncbi:ankyrin repeat-containing domain protein [Aspergillus californicus]
MCQSLFDALPYDIIALILIDVPVLDHFNLKLTGCRRLTDAIRHRQSLRSRNEYFNTICAQDARDKGLPKGTFRKPIELYIERGRPDLVLRFRARYQRAGCVNENREYDDLQSQLIRMNESSSYLLALHFAVHHGQEEIARLLLDRVNLKAGKLNRTALHYAASNNKPSMAQLLLDNGAYVNSADDYGDTPLAVAIQNGANDVADLLKAKGGLTDWPTILRTEDWALGLYDKDRRYKDSAKIEAVEDAYLPWRMVRRSWDLRRILNHLDVKAGGDLIAIHKSERDTGIQAMYENNIYILRFLLDHGLDPNRCIVSELTLLHFAVDMNNVPMTQLLIERGADPELLAGSPLSKSAFHDALCAEQAETVKYFLALGYSIDTVNEKGQTALHLAAKPSVGARPLIRSLLDLGADLEAVDLNGDTPLLYACREYCNDQWDKIRMLVEVGANVNAKNKDDCTPLLLALRRMNTETSLNITKFLLDNGASTDVKDRHGSGPLHIASDLGKEDPLGDQFIAVLYDRGADVHLRNDIGRTPLHTVLDRRILLKRATALIARGADVNEQDHELNGALHMIFSAVDTPFGVVDEACLLLLNNGATAHVFNHNHEYPLHMLCNNQTTFPAGCLVLLEQASANPNVIDSRGQSPLHKLVSRPHFFRTRCIVGEHLLSYHADVDAVDENGWTPLASIHHSCKEPGWSQEAFWTLSSMLLSHGATPFIKKSYD